MQRKVGTISVMLPLYFIMVSVINAEVKFLGGSCAKDVDCSIAFSECANSICACRAGFQASDDGLCKPRTISCPLGEVDARTAKRCAINAYQLAKLAGNPFSRPPLFVSSNSVAVDNCDADSFCLEEPYSSQLQKWTGYCCKKPVSTCLVGTPVLNVTCDPFYDFARRSCNYTTHYCFVSPALSDRFVQGLCCPRPCSTGMINVNGTCYPTVNPGESCLVNEQCPTSSQCIAGTCICNRGYVDIRTHTESGYSYGYCGEPYCTSNYNYQDRVNYRPSKPRTDADGNVVRCKDSNCQGIGEFCEPSWMVCCPVPDAFCFVPENSTTTVANVSSSSGFHSVPPQKLKAVAADTSIRCNPYSTAAPLLATAMPVKYEICSDNGSCKFWYQSRYHDANKTVPIGYCCLPVQETPQQLTSTMGF